MRALIENKDVSNGRNFGREKELISAYSIIGKVNGTMQEVLTARAYMGRSSNAAVVYASIWVHAGEFHLAGHGSAGGYGYHKESAAFQSAINSAGIKLVGSPYADENGMHYIQVPNPEFNAEELEKLEAAEDWDAVKKYKWRTPETLRELVKDTSKNPCNISGCGDGAMRSAFLAIARAVGAKGKLLVVNH